MSTPLLEPAVCTACLVCGDPSHWGPFSSGFQREGVWRRQEQALGRRLQDQNWFFVTMSRWEIGQTPNFSQRHIGGHSKTICDRFASQAAGSCSITTASLLNCVPSVLNGCRVQARLMGYEGAWRGRWFGGVWWVWRVSVFRWRSWWRCPGHLHSSCKSPVWRLFSSFINGCSLAIEAQWKDTAYIAYIASLLSAEASPTFHNLMQLYLGSIIVLVL